jgi:hypothetical protein
MRRPTTAIINPYPPTPLNPLRSDYNNYEGLAYDDWKKVKYT